MLSIEPIRGEFSLAEVEEALMVLAISGGNFKRASEQLRAAGQDLSPRRLRDWAQEVYPARYEQAQFRYADALEERLISQARVAASQAGDVIVRALELTAVQLESGDVKDPVRIARDASVVMGVNADKLLALSGRPTVVTEVRDAAQIMRALGAKLGVRDAVDGSAVELPEADLPPAA